MQAGLELRLVDGDRDRLPLSLRGCALDTHLPRPLSRLDFEEVGLQPQLLQHLVNDVTAPGQLDRRKYHRIALRLDAAANHPSPPPANFSDRARDTDRRTVRRRLYV